MANSQMQVLYTDLRGQLNSTEKVDIGAVQAGVRVSGSMQPGWESARDSELILEVDNSGGGYGTPLRTYRFANAVKSLGCLYQNDPRATLQRAVAYSLSELGVDEMRVGFESEFFLFKEVRYKTSPRGSRLKIVPFEGHGEPTDKSGHYFSHASQHANLGPVDKTAILRRNMLEKLKENGINAQRVNHECGIGQLELAMAPLSPVAAVDELQLAKSLIRQFAVENRLTATFMPKPVPWDFGSGLHVNLSAWKNGENVFFSAPGKLSDRARHFMGGILRHTKELNCITNPWSNSYRRLTSAFPYDRPPDFGSGDRTTAIRVPGFSSAEECRIEVRFPDNGANPYLAVGAILQAGVVGHLDRIAAREAPPPSSLPFFSGNLFSALNLSKERFAVTIFEAIESLAGNSAFLCAGDVFYKSIVDALLRDAAYFASWSHQIPVAEDFQITFSL